MDRERHRLLTENVSFFQEYLTVTHGLLQMCVYHGVFREDEKQTIWVSVKEYLVAILVFKFATSVTFQRCCVNPH